ncbi:MAG TPA: hypothetical protein P5087_01650 [Eubacteriales bacterium]|nr:hypothetical protein [Clostridia bacterium]HRX13716.1 hypothetical protein [Eubacteriales bacterium]
MKKGERNFLHLASFILFVVWGIGTLISIILERFGISFGGAAVVENILRICAMLVMVYCAYLYYSTHKKTLVKVLFWISVAVAIVVIVLPWFI